MSCGPGMGYTGAEALPRSGPDAFLTPGDSHSSRKPFLYA
jgi:hypothetical protein